jgi:NhaP-type Na+/H+ or K+/H+ antiporter
MKLLLLYGVFLYIATLLSARIQRSVLSTAVIFLIAGYVAGPAVLNLVPRDPDFMARFVEAAMVTVLYTDGMRVNWPRLQERWKLPGSALGIGMPLTILFTALLARFLLKFDWPQAALLGAILSPTDPVFASALVGRNEVPRRLRGLLNVESGLNDGLALPAVWISLAIITKEPSHWQSAVIELLGGAAIGLVLPLIAIRLEWRESFRAVGVYRSIQGLAIGILVYGLSSVTGANTFIAAFTAGITVAANNEDVKHHFQSFGETSAELLKLAGVMGFGTIISPEFLRETSLTEYAFAAAVLLLVRPCATSPALLGSGFSWRESLAAVWFGPKGFASVFYAIFALQSLGSAAHDVVHLTALVVAASMLAHSSTDVLVANWLVESDKPANAEARDASSHRGTAFAKPH